MSSRKPYARIAITLPQEDLDAADRRAREMQRPRSWIIAEAVRAYTARPDAPSPVDHTQQGLGPSRLAQLQADLRLSPEERVRAAEATANAIPRRDRGRVERVIGFDRYEDYLDFKRRDSIAW
jgi:hypothetical protein